MGFKCGIIGLPNVGKSTLFNALTESNKAEAANYPFATIEPNVGRVAVPDEADLWVPKKHYCSCRSRITALGETEAWLILKTNQASRQDPYPC